MSSVEGVRLRAGSNFVKARSDRVIRGSSTTPAIPKEIIRKTQFKGGIANKRRGNPEHTTWIGTQQMRVLLLDSW